MKPVYIYEAICAFSTFLSQVESLLCVPITGSGLDYLLVYILQSGYLLPVIGPSYRQKPLFFVSKVSFITCSLIIYIRIYIQNMYIIFKKAS